MTYDIAAQRACEAYYGDAQAAPGPIIQAALALIAAIIGNCPAPSAKRLSQTFPRLAYLKLLTVSYRMKLPEGVDRNELVNLAMVLATQGTVDEYAAFAAAPVPDSVKALLPN